MEPSATIIDKIWDRHVVATRADGWSLLFVDRHLVHEGSFHAFDRIGEQDRRLARPDLTFGMTDHYVPSSPASSRNNPAAAGMVGRLQRNADRHGFLSVAPPDRRHGIVHVAIPDMGLTLPGLLVVCGDSHTSTHGAFGAYAFGIGASEVAHVLATQTLWRKRPKRMRVSIDGPLPAGTSAKDLALHLIARLGADGARDHAVEYAGSTVRDLSLEGRMTLCNLSIEAGALAGLVAPDEKTFAALRGCPFAPQGDDFERAVADWRALASDEAARFDREVALSAGAIAPTVTWGTSPEQALPIDAAIPDPQELDGQRAEEAREALSYMQLRPGQRLTDIAIDRVFIGSCTNGRIEDLRAAAAILAGRRSAVPGLVSPGSAAVRRQAEQEGLDRIFLAAGLDWVASGCSMCAGMNGDLVPAGERCASTSNRNFRNRQGPGSRTHLMSPSMAAAAAVAGRLADVRSFDRRDRPA